ncbi:MAG: malto-oligosyltrehalose synthase [Phyllobacterium sp.]|uniref:malto-oligosyltrehalose synthase n=1 Tax=Phyllobacterium sp. TaxID=1871046 RepID=UPI0030F19DE7
MYVPNSAYRIQLRKETTFRHAADAVEYLKELGVDALSISSPFHTVQVGESGIVTAEAAMLDLQLGAESGFAELNSRLEGAGLPLIIDLNPSRMPASSENLWWFDVLEWGSRATYASQFDTDWTAKLTLPVLDRPADEEINAGRLRIAFDRRRGSIGISYKGSFYPFDPSTYAVILDGAETRLAETFIKGTLRATPRTSGDFHTDIQSAFQTADIAEQIELASWFNDIANEADRLAAIMALQNWCLVESSDTADVLNHEHSSDPRLTVGLRIEDPDVFESVHKAPFSLLDRTQVKGFRVNDIDEMADPEGYTRRLRERAGKDAFLVADKILLEREGVNSEWHVNGSAGYEFIATVTALLVDHDGYSTLQQQWTELDPTTEFVSDYGYAKASVLHEAFADDLAGLAQLLTELQPPHAELAVLGRAIADLVTILPVFRTYAKGGRISPFYRRVLRSAAAQILAREGQTTEENQTLDFVLGAMISGEATTNPEIAQTFTKRFQQLAAAVTARSLKQSYQYTRGPIVLDELMLKSPDAADPIGGFHQAMIEKARKEPSGLLATSYTYVTKFGEDARMRLLALSEAPEKWFTAVERLRKRQASNLVMIENAAAPDPKTEWLLYQTLAAIWPASLLIHDVAGLGIVRDDLVAFMERAIRESEKLSFWTGINKPYGQAVTDYIDQLFADETFLGDFVDAAKPFWLAGALNSFTQTVLKFTVPGVPVIRAGSETWDLSVTGSVGSHITSFDDLRNGLISANQTQLNILLEDWHSGGVKQRVMQSYLKLRQERPKLFLQGRYVPLQVTGNQAEHIVAFYREFGDQRLVVAVPRLCFSMVEQFSSPLLPLSEWEGTSLDIPPPLAGLNFRHLMTGNIVKLRNAYSLAEGFREFPVLTLVSER